MNAMDMLGRGDYFAFPVAGTGDPRKNEARNPWAEEQAEATPQMWLDAICTQTKRDAEAPMRLAVFSALRGDQIEVVAADCDDALLLLTLALNYPTQWGKTALHRIGEIVRDGEDFARWVASYDKEAA